MTTTTDTNYVLADASFDAELSRLELLQQLYDPTTIRHLDAVGIAPGWKCLEVGAGAGSISRFMAERVGAAGRVVAVDMNTRFLDAIADPRVEVKCADITTDDIGAGYDLIHTRYVLNHIRPALAAAERLISLLAPGGVFVFEEGDLTEWGPVSDGPYAAGAARACAAVNRVAEEKELFHPYLGRTLPSSLLGATGTVTAEVFRGATPDARWHELSFEGIRQHIVGEDSIDDATYDEAGLYLRDPAMTFYGIARVAVIGRRL